MHVNLAPLVEHRIRRHADEAFPEEACGLLGRTREATIRFVRYVPMANLAQSDSRFVMDPIAIARAEHALRLSGLQLGGVFHSHPAGPAVPSEADRRAAWPGLIQLILSTASGDVSAWARRGDTLARVSTAVERASRP